MTHTHSLWLLALASLMSLSGCQRTPPSPEETKAPGAPAVSVQQERSVDFGNATDNALWDKAGEAVRQGRLVAPPGNNATELYLQIRQAHPGISHGKTGQSVAEESLLDALDSLAPGLSLAIDEALDKHDPKEASRLVRLLAAAHPEYPSLPRQMARVRRAATTHGDSK
jgi:hypothetical protein